MHPAPLSQAIAAIIERFPPPLQREVADYVEFLRLRYIAKANAGYDDWTEEDLSELSMQSLRRAWGPEDSVYDNL